MRPYECGLAERAIETHALSLDLRRDVLEHVLGLAFLSLLWGFIIYLALTAALS